MKRICCVLALFCLPVAVADAAQRFTYTDLIRRLTDLEVLAVLPEEGEQSAQASSYDRRSKYDKSSGEYIEWEANGDNKGIIRREGKEQVLAEMEGPGCIWRIFSALPGAGHVKIYLDGADKPAVDLPFKGYFNLKNKPFVYPALVYQAASGLNCYIPIPYQKSCKITADDDWGAYYHFNYSTYPKGTVLPTFKRDFSLAELKAMARANEMLANCGADPAGKRRSEVTKCKTVTVGPGETSRVLRLKGKRVITAIKVKMDLPESPADRDILRELALSISWNGEREPSVWAPLGDFFGTAPGANEYRSLVMGMTDDAFYSYWYMPFEKRALVQLTNDGSEERTVTFEITYAPLSRSTRKLGYFHAKWHRDADLVSQRPIDWTMLKTKGTGRYCGTMLHVWHPKLGLGWWGEGDEKFFVDGEVFPSTFGTGSEDYFGYGWADPTLFSKAYHSQTISMDNLGHISLNRWHLGDNVPFQRSFEGAMEKYCPNRKWTKYACVAYWYLSRDGVDHYKAVSLNERRDYCLVPDLPRVPGAIEGEELKVLSRTHGGSMAQDTTDFGKGWSGACHLWWGDVEPEDMLNLLLPVAEAGEYRMKMRFTKGEDFAVVQPYLNDELVGAPVDLYATNIMPSALLDMGVHTLKEGLNKLSFKTIGANAKAEKHWYIFGLDYLLLERVAGEDVAAGITSQPSGALTLNPADGVRDYIFVPDDDSLEGMDELTIEMWIKSEDCAGEQWLYRKMGSYGMRQNNGIIDSCIVDGEKAVLTTSPGFSMTDKAWHHIAVVYSSGTETIDFYADGKLHAHDTDKNGGAVKSSKNGLTIGAYDTQFFFLNGSVDDLRIYNRALSATEIENNHSSTDAVTTDGLVSWWKLNDGSGLSVSDSMGRNYAIVVGNPMWTTDRKDENDD